MREAATDSDHTGGAVVPLLFAALCFAIAVPALVVAFVAAHLWLTATIVLRLSTGRTVRATLWLGVLVALIAFDCQLAAAPAHASTSTPVNACSLFMTQEDQTIHVVIKGCVEPFDKWLTLRPKRHECSVTHIDAVERIDEKSYLVHTTSGQLTGCKAVK